MTETMLPTPSKMGGNEIGLGANNTYMTIAMTKIPIMIETKPSVL
jgi:hypothetical protein